MLAGIWADVLGLERVGAQDNFFDLGGHSLLATQVLSRLRQVFPVAIPLRRLFEEPTLASLALAIAESGAESSDELIDPATPGEPDQLLSLLDDLSPEEIDSLLGKLIAEVEVNP
jgi:hypothetical protein